MSTSSGVTEGMEGSVTSSTTTPTTTVVANAFVKTVEAIISSTTSSISTSTSTPSSPLSPSSPSSPSSSAFSSSSSTTLPTTISSSSSSAAPLGEKLSMKDLSQTLQHFGIADYFVFIAMLAVCAVIGFYFGFIEKKQKKKKTQLAANGRDGAGAAGIEERRGSEALDYLVGGRKMKVFPVALSLVASFVSGISLLGTSTEIYVYGTQYAFILITLAFSGAISWYVFLPVFCNLQLTSTYEYFEMRFNKTARLMASALFTLTTMIWLPIVIYVPALAFNQVTGINVHIVTPVVCTICIFYTTVGGLKAVVWTDVIQTVIMVGAIIFVIIKGTIDVGGLGVVIQRNFDSGRIEWPEMTFDPKVRMSMFALMVGHVVHNFGNLGCNQIITQRYLSLPGVKEMKQASVIFIIGVTILNFICLYNGLILYAAYHDCDPLTTKLAVAKDQLVPLLVIELLNEFPGIPGMFVAGVFSAALSSLSTGLNSLAAVFLEDYIKPLRRTPLTEHQTAITMRLCTAIIGIICVALVFVVERMGTHVMQLSMTLSSVVQGPLLGLFSMGLLFPRINSKSAIAGTICSLLIMTWLMLMAQMANNSGEIHYPAKPVSIEGCDYDFDRSHLTPANATITPTEKPASLTFIQEIYNVSFMLYSCIGVCLGIIFGHLFGFVFGQNNPDDVNDDLLSPVIRKNRKTIYSSVQLEENTIKNAETFAEKS